MAPTAGTRLRFKSAQAKQQQRGKAKKAPSLKNRIRALDRFLKRGEIPDATRRAKKAELAQLQAEHEAKEHVELEKKNAEKYKKPRFFERVKIMRKLRQAKKHMDSAEDEAEAARHQADYERFREDMKYIYYYPRSEPYLSLLPSKPHSDAELQRQAQLRKDAIARFEDEQPGDAFHQFCFNDGKAADQEPAAKVSSAASLLVKRPSKEEAKKHKKQRKKSDKTASEVEPVVADMEDAELEVAAKEKKAKKAKKAKEEKDKKAKEVVQEVEKEDEEEEEEDDDFFL